MKIADQKSFPLTVTLSNAYSDTKIGISLDSQEYQIMLVFAIFCSICVVMILATRKLEYLWTHKSWRAKNFYFDRFWHGESENCS